MTASDPSPAEGQESTEARSAKHIKRRWLPPKWRVLDFEDRVNWLVTVHDKRDFIRTLREGLDVDREWSRSLTKPELVKILEETSDLEPRTTGKTKAEIVEMLAFEMEFDLVGKGKDVYLDETDTARLLVYLDANCDCEVFRVSD